MAFFQLYEIVGGPLFRPMFNSDFRYNDEEYDEIPEGHTDGYIDGVTISLAENAISELEFNLYKGHRMYDTIEPLKTRIFASFGVAPYVADYTDKIAYGIPFMPQSVTEDIDGIKHVYAIDIRYGLNDTFFRVDDPLAKCALSPKAVLTEVGANGWNMGKWGVAPDITEKYGEYSKVSLGVYNKDTIGKSFNEQWTEAANALNLHSMPVMTIKLYYSMLMDNIEYKIEYKPLEEFLDYSKILKIKNGEKLLSYEEKNSLEDVCTICTAYCEDSEGNVRVAEYQSPAGSHLYGIVHKMIKIDGEVSTAELERRAREYVSAHLARTVSVSLNFFDDSTKIFRGDQYPYSEVYGTIALYDLVQIETRSHYINTYYISSIKYDLINVQNTEIGLTLLSSVYNARNNLLTDSNQDNMLMVNYTEALEFIDIGG